jgi:iron complex transport system substrate-binding protein
MSRAGARRILILGMLLLAACGPSSATEETDAPAVGLAITDARGETVEFAAPPERVTIAGRGNSMVVNAVYLFPQAETRVVALPTSGQTLAEDFIALVDPAYDEKIHFAREVGAEQIAAVQPDVVLLKRYAVDRLGGPLEALGVPVAAVELETPAQYERDLRLLGQLLGAEARAEEVLEFYRRNQDRVAQALSNLPEDERPQVLLVQYNDRGGEVAFHVPPASWIQTTLVEQAGGQPVWTAASQGDGWTVVNFEQIAVWDPDRIFVVNYFGDVDETVGRLVADPAWQSLTAVETGQIYAFPKDFYSWDQPDPRWILGLTWLATRIHPTRFEEVDMTAQILDFFGHMYRLDEATVREQILPRLQGDVE